MVGVVRAGRSRSWMCLGWSSMVELSLSKVKAGWESLGMVKCDLGRIRAWWRRSRVVCFELRWVRIVRVHLNRVGVVRKGWVLSEIGREWSNVALVGLELVGGGTSQSH